MAEQKLPPLPQGATKTPPLPSGALSFENLDRNTLQYQGEYLLPLIHYFAEADLSTLKAEEDYVYFNIPAFKMISYPFTWIIPILVIAIIVFIALIVFGIKKQNLL